eukprot:GDKJ01043538.1.p1 GENE.GDKJ01043538.1~~GDKJ01043538.1.p1  ORF type:complete len:179 (-),score=3.75 GDKJ01043538.1:93-629(-)
MVSKFTPSSNNSRSLLVFNTHLDPMNDNRAIERQLAELKATIAFVLQKENESKTSSESHISAVVVGDFNISPESSLYSELFTIMSCTKNGEPTAKTDVVRLRELFSSTSKSVHTYDPANPMVLWPEAKGRLDHIFAIDGVIDSAGSHCQLQPVELISESVIKEPIVSDHYPFAATISF